VRKSPGDPPVNEPATPKPRPDRILVVDDDRDIARFVEVNLTLQGFEVVVAHDGAEALELVTTPRPGAALTHPDLAIVDLMMPRMDGLELTRQLRANPLTASMPIIMLTARGLTVDKVLGLTAGADDYLVKPFDTLELVARVNSTLRRNQEYREVSPLTGLPGNTRILREIAERVRGGTDYAVCHVDIDRFKSVNDAYGFARGDEFISALARAIQRAVVQVGLPPAFLGHIGGDDFVIVCTPEQRRGQRLRERRRRAVRPGRRAARVPGADRPQGRGPAPPAGDHLDRGGGVHQPALRGPARGDRGGRRDEAGRQEPAGLVCGGGPPLGVAPGDVTRVAGWARATRDRGTIPRYPPRAGGTR
jgi:DNA-binding response OmpR family regulator